ncbi:MAG: type II toxin-antitoxin system RelE/ParE family toxin [Clostridiales bacterium]
MAKIPQYSIIISERTQKMLGAHIGFLAKVSAIAAREMRAEMMKAIRSLAIMPERFPFLEAEHLPPNKYHKMCVENRYLILYQIKDQKVYIDYIVDCRQDYGWLIK